MLPESKEFLFNLLKTPSPTGFEEKIQQVVKKRMHKYAEVIDSDYHGNLIIGINTKAKTRVMLAGHCDQIGLIVKHITDAGFIYVSPLGGIDVGVLPGTSVTIYAESGPVTGVIGRKPIHHQTNEERGKVKGEIKDIWIDIGAKSKKEVQKKIQIGDYITFSLGVTELMNGLVVSPGLDDKVGLFVAMETLRMCCDLKKMDVALFAVSTVQEEVGLRGAQTAAYGIDPHVGIAIDVTHASDNPGQDDTKATPCKLNEGPVIVRGPNINPIVSKMLIDAAKSNKIPYQIDSTVRPLGNDANVIQVTRRGVAAGSIGIPNRYMHTQAEVCALKDLENSAKLLTNFINNITAKTDFRPTK